MQPPRLHVFGLVSGLQVDLCLQLEHGPDGQNKARIRILAATPVFPIPIPKVPSLLF